jgi:D-beta-D-heptose 7-phosphate kinase/D-beta-D-heptose 1-phosphate adenosyltransferase
MDEWARANVLCAMGFVDYVILFREDTPYKLIKELKPDYLVKGGDWQVNQIIGREFVKKIFRVKHYPDYSTTGIVQKIKNA